MSKFRTLLTRDISWLSFNERVLQEASDPAVPLPERIRFLGIFSNNLDEFFRVRVATLKRMVEFGRLAKMHFEEDPAGILDQIQRIVIRQQEEFSRIWRRIKRELKQTGVQLVTEKQLTGREKKFVLQYFEQEVRSQIIPLMIESIPQFPPLRDEYIYLAVVLSCKDQHLPRKYALIEIPTGVLPRFVMLPSTNHEKRIILLEDIIRVNLPSIFAYFGYDQFTAHVIKMTRDAELDIDNDVSTSFIQQIEKALKKRKHGRPVRFIYDRQIDPRLLDYLIKRLNLTKKDHLIPGDRIHNFKDFMEFPDLIFQEKRHRRKSFIHPLLHKQPSITHIVMQRDVLLHFPYHDFNSLIDLLREAAIDPDVQSIHITAYRLATHSKVINALINAVRNGKKVFVVIELRARFNEEENLRWKTRLEEEGVKVYVGFPDMKIHAKIALIEKIVDGELKSYGFVCTGNLNEDTATYYADFCLLTSRPNIMADIRNTFAYLESNGMQQEFAQSCKTIVLSPFKTREVMLQHIHACIKAQKHGLPAKMILKMNALSDPELILAIYDAAKAGVNIQMIIRSICCAYTSHDSWKKAIQAISIVDEYLEHGRIFYFQYANQEYMYISSADWMIRNLNHRVEATVPIHDPILQDELLHILQLQLHDNVKARILDNSQQNRYVPTRGRPRRSQLQIYNYLYRKKYRA
ncbi:MAG: polyphosphate kinase 1 [Thermoflavifilum sp.]|nr:polyphosphate kinase 1 [Thermoflavifilum sp.]